MESVWNGGRLNQGKQTGLSFSTRAEMSAAKPDVGASIVSAGGREKPWDTTTGPRQQICRLKVIRRLGSSWKAQSSHLTLPSPKRAPPHQGSLKARNLEKVMEGALGCLVWGHMAGNHCSALPQLTWMCSGVGAQNQGDTG